MQKLLITMAVFWQVLNVSAYAETGNRTASGVWPTAGVTCAADHLPFGSRVTLPDGRTWIVQDRFGAGWQDHLDLYMGNEQECWQFGRQYLRCRIETPQ